MNGYSWLRPLLWKMDPERAHDLALTVLARASASRFALQWLKKKHGVGGSDVRVHAFGLSFPNPVGLAAGMDKDGRALPGLAALGFGFLEVGTVTPKPQKGNPKPRLWRLPAHGALLNRMGFNNEGADTVAGHVAKARAVLPLPLGVNIGKNAATPLADALHDYRRALHTLAPWADYIVVNISSPNTPGLRDLQHASALDDLLGALRREVDALPAGSPTRAEQTPSALAQPLPLLVKVAPDLGPNDLDHIAETCTKHRIDGIVATNTTVARPGIPRLYAAQAGGLSGAPLQDMSNKVVAGLYRRLGGRLPIVGVGGIMDPNDAYAKIKAGATLIQVLTGFVYGGPNFPKQLITGLQQRLAQDGFTHIAQAVGIEAHRYDDPTGAVNAGKTLK